MSLVNDMLRDLDRRANRPQQGGLATPEPAAPRRVPAWLGLLVLLPLAFVFGLQWQQQGNSAEEPGVDAAPAAPSELADSGAKAAEPEGGKPQETAQLAPAENAVTKSEAPVEQSDSGQREKIDSLLAEADRALAEDRLTSPRGDNAYLRYQTVLLLEPDQPAALAGIRAVADRYVAFFLRKLAEGEGAQAEYYRNKAREVVAGETALEQWLEQRLAAAPAPTTVAEDPLAAEAVPATEPVEAAARAEKSAVAIAPSRSELDKRNAARARQLIEQGRHGAARDRLLAHLRDYPAADRSRQLLFESYLASGDFALAEAQLNAFGSLPDHEAARLEAQLRLAQEQPTEAIAVMEASAPDLRRAPAWHAFLAALYHRNGRYRDAVGLYRELLQIRREEGTWWLGLAVSLDALQDRSAALEAFRYARAYSAADASSRSYVEERIRQLSS